MTQPKKPITPNPPPPSPQRESPHPFKRDSPARTPSPDREIDPGGMPEHVEPSKPWPRDK